MSKMKGSGLWYCGYPRTGCALKHSFKALNLAVVLSSQGTSFAILCLFISAVRWAYSLMKLR